MTDDAPAPDPADRDDRPTRIEVSSCPKCDLDGLQHFGECERTAVVVPVPVTHPTSLAMPNGDLLECDYPNSSDWAKSWSIRYASTGRIGTTQEQDWELVETYGLTAILEAFQAASPSQPSKKG